MDGAVVNCRNEGAILPNCCDLDWAQIIYAVHYKRLLFIHRSQTWSSFYTETSNGFTYCDYTAEELCHRFLHYVLPNIYEYELTEDEFHLLSLLNLHPNFEKTSTGFKIVERSECLLFPSDEAAVNTLVAAEVSRNEQKFFGSNIKSNQQIITIGANTETSGRKFNFNTENAALLSVVLCSDEELPNCDLLTEKEVFNRLKSAKAQFEDNGYQLENVNISLDGLLTKMQSLIKLKDAVTKLIDSRFCQQN